MLIGTDYFQDYRRQLGFTNQSAVKNFFGAKDIVAEVDMHFIAKLNERLAESIRVINRVIIQELRPDSLDGFIADYINRPYEIIVNNHLLPRLNNQGRRPEQVYFSWMRGYIFANYFRKSLCQIFDVDFSQVSFVGDDDFSSLDTFKRTPKADIEIELNHKNRVHIEMQTGFTGINDIKQHKVIEAKRLDREDGIETIAIHFDLYNGQVAFLKLNQIEESNMHWISRQQMEGQTVFNIDQNFFIWKITEPPPQYTDIKFEY
ncbi:MAG: restriction endonuclease [Candidatus Pacebacteria bacterium]|nr:restriction endonuclease [Candidatus Paceibacterota bacterium]